MKIIIINEWMNRNLGVQLTSLCLLNWIVNFNHWQTNLHSHSNLIWSKGIYNVHIWLVNWLAYLTKGYMHITEARDVESRLFLRGDRIELCGQHAFSRAKWRHSNLVASHTLINDGLWCYPGYEDLSGANHTCCDINWSYKRCIHCYINHISNHILIACELTGEIRIGL